MIFLNSASSAAAVVFYLPGVCTHTDTEGKQRKTRVRNILKSLEKTQYLMNSLYVAFHRTILRLFLENHINALLTLAVGHWLFYASCNRSNPQPAETTLPSRFHFCRSNFAISGPFCMKQAFVYFPTQ